MTERIGVAKYPGLSALPGYIFVRTGSQGAIDAAGKVAYFAADIPAVNDKGFYSYGTLTNALLYSQDFVNAGWGKSTTAPTLTAGQVDPAGGTAAVIVNDTSATIYENMFQSITIPADTLTRTFSIFVKKFASAGQRFGINTSIQGGTDINSNVRLDPFTGVVTAGVGAAYVIDCGGWWRLALTVTNNGSAGNTNFNISIYPAAAVTGTGSDDATATGAVTLYQAQVLTGEFRDGGPIITTTTAAATIGAANLRVSEAPSDVDQLFFATADFSLPNNVAPNRTLAIWTNPAVNQYVHLWAAQNVVYGQIVVGTSVYAATTPYTLAGKITIVARRSGGNWRSGYISGGVLTWAGANTAGAFPVGMTLLSIGGALSGAATNDPIPGVFRKHGSFTTDAAVLAAVAETG